VKAAQLVASAVLLGAVVAGAALAITALTGAAPHEDAESRTAGPVPTASTVPRPDSIVFREFTARDGRIWADGHPIDLLGLNWSGLDTPDRAPHGLWTGRSLDDFFGQVRAAGFTAIRLPITPEVLRPDTTIANWAIRQGYGPNGDDMLRQTLAAARRNGLWAVLAFNSFDSRLSGGDTPRPFYADGPYRKADWLADLAAMARLARTAGNVVGIDLFNEPHGLAWSEWKDLASEAGAAVLAANPAILVFVQGVAEWRTATGGYGAFWGANLVEADENPIDPALLPHDKLVLSPHVYGPDVYGMPYFSEPDFPENMPGIWDTHFGHLAGAYAVCLGEFGGRYAPQSPDAVWQDAFVDYMTRRPGMSSCWFYWQLSPDSADTGGLLAEDWQAFDPRKLALLRRLIVGATN